MLFNLQITVYRLFLFLLRYYYKKGNKDPPIVQGGQVLTKKKPSCWISEMAGAYTHGSIYAGVGGVYVQVVSSPSLSPSAAPLCPSHHRRQHTD
jgi:hypothetical protein